MSEPVADDDGLLAYANFRFDHSQSAASPATAAAASYVAGSASTTTAPSTPTYLQRGSGSNGGGPGTMYKSTSSGANAIGQQPIAYPFSQQPLTQIPEYGPSQPMASQMGPVPHYGYVNVHQQTSSHHPQQAQQNPFQLPESIHGPQNLQQPLSHHPLPLPSPPPTHHQQFMTSPGQHVAMVQGGQGTVTQGQGQTQVLQGPQQGPPVQATQSHGQPTQPFSYIPSIASTTPVHGGKTRARGPRRRRTGSKRSLEEMILESTIPTNISTNMQQVPQRTGPSISLITGVGSAAGLMSPSMLATSAPTLPLTVPEPPLSTAIPSNPTAMNSDSQPRPKKKSKYSAEQDDIILQMKREGKSWSDIAEAANCGNALAARNRYQVLIGQQGGGAVAWDSDDAVGLKMLLEKGEKAKWDYIATEVSRMRSKDFTASDCQGIIKQLFEENPAFFGIVVGPSMPPPSSSALPNYSFPPIPNNGGTGYYGPQPNELELMASSSYGGPPSDYMRK
jgi:hypothetical protein